MNTDVLISDTGLRVDYVLANPPFGKKSSMTFTNEEGEQDSEDPGAKKRFIVFIQLFPNRVL